jgi:predicted amidohydrolase YtcJ
MSKPITPFILILVCWLASCGSHQKADRIYYNAKVWTGDSTNEWATCIAVRDSLIQYVGLDYKPYQGEQTQMIDLGGKMVVPGFIDNHTHFLAGGFQLASVDLRQAKSQGQFIGVLSQYIAGLKDNRWIQGGDWDHEAWGGILPHKEWIDSVSGQHPVFINRYDGHMALANSFALKKAGIDRNTQSPEGGEIVKDPVSGEPTGILKDAAMGLLDKVIPIPSEEELDESLERAIRHAWEHGLTEIQDMGSYGGWVDLASYRRAYAKNRLGVRVYSFVPTATWRKLDSFIKKNGWGDDRLHWGGLKGFVDGSLGSTTAWFYQPYLDAPHSSGLMVTDTGLLRSWVLSADSAGLHVTNHAIGDRANDWILSVYKEAVEKNGSRDRRFRVEHAQHLDSSAIGRFAAQGVIPSMQPYHAIDDGKWAYKRLDSARLKGTYAFRRLLSTGARLTFGSDWTVAPLDPIAGIYAAVTRRTLDDKNPDGWFPDEKITVGDALRCYTVNNAYAGFQESKIGQLKAGMLSDFAVLSGDLFNIPPEKIREVQVLRTIVNGKEVYRRDQ